MAKDPAVLFYPSDFIGSTALWTDADVGKYIRLLCYQHINGGLLPDDFDRVCECSERVRAKFELHEDGLYYNSRMLSETQRRKAYSESRSKNVSKRYHNNSIADEVTYEPTYVEDMNLHMGNRNININSNNNISKDREIVKREREEREAQIEERFNRFWGSYPRKVQKIDARKAFHKLDPDEELLGAIIKAVEASKNSKAWQDEGGAFIPYPATYLNGRRWEDEEPERKAESPRFGNYDPEEALRLAIQRSMKG